MALFSRLLIPQIMAIGLFLLNQYPAIAAIDSKNFRFHEMTKLGQAEDFDFAFPVDPLLQSREKVLVPQSWESGVFVDSISNMIVPEAVNLNTWWEDQLSDQLLCPNNALGANLDYIQYLYRLVTVSYLFEAMTEYHTYLGKLGIADKSCSLEWQDLFADCKPTGEEMKKFIIRLKGRHLLGLDQRDSALLGPSDQEVLLKAVEDGATKTKNQILNPLPMRLQNYCSHNFCPRPMDKKWFKSTVSDFCKSEKRLIQLICSEQDQLYGISKIPEARLLVEHSNAMTIIRQTGHGAACLSRFTELFSKEEKSYENLELIYQSVWNKITNSEGRYLQGNAFVLGSLKEFDDKGLTDVLVSRVEQKEVKDTPVIAAVEAPKAQVSESTKTPEPVVTEVKVEKPLEIKKPVKIQFEVAVDEREKSKLDRVAVNMELMHQDYIFAPKMLSLLSGPMRRYQTRKALEEMKKFDHLGTQKEPVRLIFLKFLIDHDFHQGLYNMTSVLGDKFWVLNDITGINEPRYIELRNDETTNHRWQIYVVKPPESLDDAVKELKAKLKS
jgi:hypothetical protein